MRKPFVFGARRLRRLAIAASAAVGLIGCGPSDYGALDVAKSKAVAAERKIGPALESSPVQTVKTGKRGRRSRPVQTGPAAPPPPPG